MSEAPPHDLDAEAQVLGAAMLAPPDLDQTVALLSPGDFYRPVHELVWQALTELHEAGKPVDWVSVSDRLRANGELARCGGPTGVHGFVDGIVTSENVLWHARIVKRLSGLRRLLEASTRGVQLATSGTDEDPTALAGVIVEELLLVTGPTQAPTLATQVEAAIDAIETSANGAWSWPWADVRRLVLPPAAGQFILLAARPRVGKSVALTDIARFVALHCELPVVLHTLEMSATEVLHRILAAEAKVPLDHIKRNTLTGDEWERVAKASQKIAAAPLVIDDNPVAGLADFRASIRQHKPVLLLVDYLQLVRTNPGQKDRRLALEELSRGLKVLAKTERLPVITAAQVNRKSMDRADKAPMLSDLRETGALEQDADVVILIHRDDAEEPECERAGEVDMIVAKQRNGPAGKALLIHQLHYSRFVDPAA